MAGEYEQLKELATMQGMTIEQVAERVNLSRVGLKKAFDNESLRKRQFKELAGIFGLSMDELEAALTGVNAVSEARADHGETQIQFLEWLADHRETIRKIIEANK